MDFAFEAQPCVARPFNVSAGKVVVTQGDTDRDLFIIEHGVAEVLVEGMDETVEYLPEGPFFGEMNFSVLRPPRTSPQSAV